MVYSFIPKPCIRLYYPWGRNECFLVDVLKDPELRSKAFVYINFGTNRSGIYAPMDQDMFVSLVKRV